MLATKIAASTGVSSARNGRIAGLGSACPIASKHSEQFQRQHDGRHDDGPLDHDVVAPVLWKRRRGTAHRAISQVVTGLPSASLPSFSTTPIAASSSRIRSDSLKSFRARASLRLSNKSSTALPSTPRLTCLRDVHSSEETVRSPKNSRESTSD